MSRSKLQRFQENAERNNIIEPGKPVYSQIKGNWRELHFKNNFPIVLELACGYGEYSVGLGRIFREKNFIGVDIKGARIWRGSGIALNEGLTNVAFLRTRIQFLEDFFEAGEVDEIWIVFPDPRPRDRDIKRRLTHPRFLEMYKKLMKPAGTIHLKTDNDILYDYSLEVLNQEPGVEIIAQTRDLYYSPLLKDHHDIRTKYESRFHAEGHEIKYLKFRFKDK